MRPPIIALDVHNEMSCITYLHKALPGLLALGYDTLLIEAPIDREAATYPQLFLDMVHEDIEHFKILDETIRADKVGLAALGEKYDFDTSKPMADWPILALHNAVVPHIASAPGAILRIQRLERDLATGLFFKAALEMGFKFAFSDLPAETLTASQNAHLTADIPPLLSLGYDVFRDLHMRLKFDQVREKAAGVIVFTGSFHLDAFYNPKQPDDTICVMPKQMAEKHLDCATDGFLLQEAESDADSSAFADALIACADARIAAASTMLPPDEMTVTKSRRDWSLQRLNTVLDNESLMAEAHADPTAERSKGMFMFRDILLQIHTQTSMPVTPPEGEDVAPIAAHKPM